MNGTLKSVDATSITVTKPDGSDVTTSIKADATFTRDGSPAKVGDLKVGDNVTVTGNPATSISATSA